ncbi:GNAT family N-acetyltransferase [Paenibacillus abyssi]|uniref:Acetyltransferase n=1 Tax=Paenibacillus abyssi TaxID=1340531 RepID=A0A917FTT8_9BACL|nr:GNAT family N-acetyltransferase [Paenibacillus abyssi]GGG00746.1 acetyltransferase [Paenibacillus abyssi]
MSYILVTNEEQLEAVYRIRREVFVEEQGVPAENEFDEYETVCDHILVYHEEQPIGTGRLRIADGAAKMERICILASYRKFGLGKEIMASLESLAQTKGLRKAKLHAQTHAQSFYEKLGYRVKSDVFMEEGIPHVSMEKELAPLQD